MTLTALRDTQKIDGAAIPTIYELPAAVDINYNGGMAVLNAAGFVVPAGSATGTTAVLGRVERTIDNSGGSAGDENVPILPGQFKYDNSGSSIASTDRGKLCYAVDDESVHLSNAGGRAIAGMITRVDSDGVVFQTLFHAATLAAAAAAGLSAGPTFYARGASTADIANLAAFTVAGVDGLTYVEGEIILLKNQAAPAENGCYICGVVGAGTCALSRIPEMDDASELVPNIVVRVSEGTIALDTEWTVTTNATIVVGTTALTWIDTAYGFGLAAAMSATGEAAAAGTANDAARIDHVHAEHSRSVTAVATADIPNIAAFVVTQDGVVLIEGELVLLANQTVPAESGVYVVGVVAGTAPLTRVGWLPAAAIVRGGYTVHVEEGTLFASTNWFIAEAGAITIATTAHTYYPEKATFEIDIPPGTGTVTWADIPILSATKTQFMFTNRAEVTADLTVRYGLNGAATPGVVGTCTATMIAEIAAGTVNVDDDSSMLISVINR